MSVTQVNQRLAALTAAGTSVWLDQIRRGMIESGELARMVEEDSLRGVTSNPAIFEKAILGSADYDADMASGASEGLSAREVYRRLAVRDVQLAADVLRPVYDASNGRDGRVSIEVDPRLAHDTENTIAEAKALWWLVDRPNLFIKIPATLAGLPAITATLAEGISVNVTLIFSLERYEQVMRAFQEGVAQAKANGKDLSDLQSVASFFVSRFDTEIDKRLEKIGSPDAEAMMGKAAVANARLAYELYEKVFDNDEWRSLKAAGANEQRPLWASTSTKNPKYRDIIYVEQLIAPGTVNTMPEPVIHAFADHGETADTVRPNYELAHQEMARLAEVGIDLDDVYDTLEREGVEKFEASWNELLAGVQKSLEAAREGAEKPNQAAKAVVK